MGPGDNGSGTLVIQADQKGKEPVNGGCLPGGVRGELGFVLECVLMGLELVLAVLLC